MSHVQNKLLSREAYNERQLHDCRHGRREQCETHECKKTHGHIFIARYFFLSISVGGIDIQSIFRRRIARIIIL